MNDNNGERKVKKRIGLLAGAFLVLSLYFPLQSGKGDDERYDFGELDELLNIFIEKLKKEESEITPKLKKESQKQKNVSLGKKDGSLHQKDLDPKESN